MATKRKKASKKAPKKQTVRSAIAAAHRAEVAAVKAAHRYALMSLRGQFESLAKDLQDQMRAELNATMAHYREAVRKRGK